MTETEWPPIDTAPRDGTIILTVSNNEIYVTRWSKEQNYWQFRDALQKKVGDELQYEYSWFTYIGGLGSINPTHWKPLPQPPKE